MSDQSEVFDFLLRRDDTNVVGFETWLAEAATNRLGKGGADATSFAFTRKARLWTELKKLNDLLVLRGRRPAAIIVDDRSRFFRVPNFADGATSAEKYSSGDRAKIIRFVDSFNNSKFEYLGAALAWFAGATYTKVTKGSGDGGVDFYAVVPAWGASGVFHSPYIKLRIVGQSKYYSSSMNVEKARAFCSTLNDIRSRSQGMEIHIPNWFRSDKGPIVGAMVASGGFDFGANLRSQDHGILMVDSVDLAEGIASTSRYRKMRLSGKEPGQAIDLGLAAVGWNSHP